MPMRGESGIDVTPDRTEVVMSYHARSPFRSSFGSLRSFGTHRRVAWLAFLCLTVAAIPRVDAQDYVLSAPSATVDNQGSTTVVFSLDNSSGQRVTGISASICFDPNVVTAISTAAGAATLALNGGVGAEFFVPMILPDAVTLGLVTELLGNDGYLPAVSHEYLEITFQAVGPPLASSPLAFCTAGNPPVPNLLIHDPSQTNSVPATSDGTIDIGPFEGAVLAIDASLPAVAGGSVTAEVLLDASEAVEEISFGLTYDGGDLNLTAVSAIGDLAATNGGAGPSVFLVDTAPAGTAAGVTVEVIVDNSAPVVLLAPGFDLPIFALDFAVAPGAGPSCSTSPLSFDAGLGSPTVDNQVTATVGPLSTATVDGTITFVTAPVAAPSGGVTLSLDSAAPPAGQPATITAILDSDQPIGAVSFGIAFDATDVSLIGVSPGFTWAQSRCGAGPELFLVGVFGGANGGMTIETIIQTTPPFSNRFLLPDGAAEFLILDFTTVPIPAVGGTSLTFTDTLGSPPVPITVETPGGLVTPAASGGAIDLAVPFTRGDCNADSNVDIADTIFALGFLFPPVAGPSVVTCLDACDLNDDGQMNIGDPINLLGILFSPGLPPPIPAPNSCGLDPTGSDGLSCESFAACP